MKKLSPVMNRLMRQASMKIRLNCMGENRVMPFLSRKMSNRRTSPNSRPGKKHMPRRMLTTIELKAPLHSAMVFFQDWSLHLLSNGDARTDQLTKKNLRQRLRLAVAPSCDPQSRRLPADMGRRNESAVCAIDQAVRPIRCGGGGSRCSVPD